MFSVAILAKNSAPTILKALNSVKSSPEVIVFDDGSNDSTLQIVKSQSVKILSLPNLVSFADKRNWAMSKCSHEWVFFLDSDEEMSFPVTDISKLISHSSAVAFAFHRRDILWDSKVIYGDNSSVLVRLMKKNTGKWVGDVHEKWQTDKGFSVIDSELTIIHYPILNLYTYISKLNHYSSLRAKELHASGRKVSIFEIIVWPIGKFVHLYLLRLGILDGMPGLISALGMSFYTFLVRAKLWSIYQNLSV